MNEKEFRENLLGRKDNYVYHYCSIDALFGILSSKSMWLTSLSSTNDSKELKISNKKLDESIDDLIKKSNDIFITEVLKKIKESPKNKKMMRKNKLFDYYGLSFVDRSDSLTHWERYGNQNEGVCIKINTSIIRHMFENNGISEKLCSWFKLKKIVYNDESQTSLLNDSLFEFIDSIYGAVGHRILKEDEFCFSIYYSLLSMTMPMFKDKGFSDERELKYCFEAGGAEELIKLLKNPNMKEPIKRFIENLTTFINEKGLSLNKKSHAVFNGNIRSYFSLNLEEVWSNTLIPEIMLGPKCSQNKKELKSFLKQNGLNGTKIKVSQVPIR